MLPQPQNNLSTAPGLSPAESQLASQAGAPTVSQPSTQQSVSLPTQTSSTNQQGQLDPDAVNLAKAIRQTESGGNFQATGQSGEYGAYQWLPDSWNKMAADAGVSTPLQQATPAEQNKVAYTQIKAWKDAGYNVGQIASMWNAGEAKPNAYLTGNTGTNSEGVSYDTGAYAQKVATAYQQLKAQGGYGGAQAASGQNSVGYGGQPLQSSQQPATDTSSQQEPPTVDSISNYLSQGNILGALGKGAADIANFAFPIEGDVINDIKGDSTKNALQQAGDLGLSALPFTGIGDVGDLLRGGLGIGEGAGTLTKLLTGTAANAGVGYGADIASNLSQGKTGANVLTPGLGTVAGGVLGGAGEALSGAGEGIASRLNSSIMKPLARDISYGKDPAGTVAKLGVTGNSLPDWLTNIVKTRGDVGSAIGQIANQVKTPFDLSSSIAPLDEAMETAAKQNNPALVSRLMNTRQALTDNMTLERDATGSPTGGVVSAGARDLTNSSYADAMKLKSQIGDVTNWTGNNSDDTIANRALQGVWSNISSAQKQAVEAVSPELRKELETLNGQYGDLTAASVALKRRIPVAERQNLVSLGDMLFGGLGTAVGGGGVAGAVTGLASGLAKHLAGTPAVKTRLASLLARGGTSGLLPGLLKSAAIRGASSVGSQ